MNHYIFFSRILLKLYEINIKHTSTSLFSNARCVCPYNVAVETSSTPGSAVVEIMSHKLSSVASSDRLSLHEFSKLVWNRWCSFGRVNFPLVTTFNMESSHLFLTVPCSMPAGWLRVSISGVLYSGLLSDNQESFDTEVAILRSICWVYRLTNQPNAWYHSDYSIL